MAWTYLISEIRSGDTATNTFGQLQFSGSYVTGGDSGTLQNGGNSIGLPQFLETSQLHASRPPVEYNIQLDAGWLAVVIPGTRASDFKIKIVNPTTQAELPAGPYPAALAAANGNHTMALAYRKNL